MEYSELEIQFSPTFWSRRYPPEEVISRHISFAKEVSEKNKKNIPCELNVPYGEKEKQKFDIFGTDLPKDSSIFIFIHGGYWQELDRNYSSYVVEPFYKNKIKTIVFGYTNCPGNTIDGILIEIKQAMHCALNYAKKHESKAIYLSGYSAGSQLISHLFQNYLSGLPTDDQNLFRMAILCCGVYDLTPLIDTYINAPLNLTLTSAATLSPLHQKISKLPRQTYVVIGENESPSFIEQSQLFYEKIKALGDVQFKLLSDTDHFSIVENYSCDDYELVRLIVESDKQLK